jgi:hypothetical protein
LALAAKVKTQLANRGGDALFAGQDRWSAPTVAVVTTGISFFDNYESGEHCGGIVRHVIPSDER